MATTAPPREQKPAARQTTERTADLDALFPGKYLGITSFKRDGTGVATPVWFVSDGTRLFAFTDLHSAKIRRIHHNPRVLVASCWVNGKLRRQPVAARAQVLTATADLWSACRSSCSRATSSPTAS
jgi:PPOX class probable F420-dependent enzyme